METAIRLNSEKQVKKDLFSRFFPSLPTAQLSFCFLVPCAFLLFQLVVGFMALQQMVYFSLSAFLLSSSFALSRLRWIGLVCGLAILSVPVGVFSSHYPNLYWALGYLGAQSLSLLLFFLCSREVSVVFEEIEKKDNSRVKQYHQLAQDHAKEIKAQKEKEQSLSKELESWKEQAEQRALDYSSLEEKMRLYDEQVRHFQNQKDELVERAFEGQKELTAHKERIEKVALLEKQLVSQLETLESDKEALRQQIRELEQKCEEKEQTTQLSKRALLSKKLALASLQALVESQEVGDQTELKRQVAKTQGMYGQLKEQFRMKNQTLHDTRKELFFACEAIDAMKLELSHRQKEEAHQSLRLVQEATQDLEQELKETQQELATMEALVSHILHE